MCAYTRCSQLHCLLGVAHCFPGFYLPTLGAVNFHLSFLFRPSLSFTLPLTQFASSINQGCKIPFSSHLFFLLYLQRKLFLPVCVFFITLLTSTPFMCLHCYCILTDTCEETTESCMTKIQLFCITPSTIMLIKTPVNLRGIKMRTVTPEL